MSGGRKEIEIKIERERERDPSRQFDRKKKKKRQALSFPQSGHVTAPKPKPVLLRQRFKRIVDTTHGGRVSMDRVDHSHAHRHWVENRQEPVALPPPFLSFFPSPPHTPTRTLAHSHSLVSTHILVRLSLVLLALSLPLHTQNKPPFNKKRSRRLVSCSPSLFLSLLISFNSTQMFQQPPLPPTVPVAPKLELKIKCR